MTKVQVQPSRPGRVELKNQVFEHVSDFSLGTFNYEVEGAFKETQYVPIFPDFYRDFPGHDWNSLWTSQRSSYTSVH